MKKIAEFICRDQPGHIILTGGAIRKYFDSTVTLIAEERKDYVLGLFTVYPYMFLGNYHKWLFAGETCPKNYQEFMRTDQPGIISQVVPILDTWYDEKSPLPYNEKVKAKISLFTDVPFLILGAYHNWLYNGGPEAKDFQDFVQDTKPALTSVLGKIVLKAYYDLENPLSPSEKTEIMLFFGTEYAHILLRKYYTWLFGEDKSGLPGPPPEM